MYVKCCLDPNVQDKYGVALGLIKEEGERVSDKEWSGVGGGRQEEAPPPNAHLRLFWRE